MGTADTSDRVPPFLEDLFVNLLERLEPSGQPPGHRAWPKPTIRAIINFPREETELPDGRRPLRQDTAVELILFMLRHLNDDTPPPTSVNPTGDGGVTAQWHVKDYQVGNYCEPDEPLEYSVRTPDVECEGIVQGEEARKWFREDLQLMPTEPCT